nr:PREDICTED: OX-2 membrane glycoprotein-like isoform X1 [Lepisosteus oculatus]XP_015219014.1 PREDICTED: OX-2 membrane glycoprotein-like isoform X1 [Lepisosteus oculatus]
MYDAVLHRCLLLCVSLMLPSRLQGEVTSHQYVKGILGERFTIQCNISLQPGESVMQVRWLDVQNKTLLSYIMNEHKTETEGRVFVNLSRPDASAITFSSLSVKDDGCHRCAFDVYPSGLQEGKTCITVIAEVKPGSNKTVVSGKSTDLQCSYGVVKHVQQVLWRKITPGSKADVASYSKMDKGSVKDLFKDRFTISHGLQETRISISPVKPEDDACFSCEFNTYPYGTKKGVTCLTVYVLPKPQLDYRSLGPGIIGANCSAVGKPAPEISWNVETDNRTFNVSHSSKDRADGTTLVISTLFVQASLLDEKSVKCIVHHRGLESPIGVTLNTKIHVLCASVTVGTALTILITVTAVAALLVLCLCICLWRCFLRKDDAG